MHKDKVHLLVEDGDDIVVGLKAEGVGTSIYCATPLNIINLGNVFTANTCSTQFRLENKGRRQQVRGHWHRQRQKKIEQLAAGQWCRSER